MENVPIDLLDPVLPDGDPQQAIAAVRALQHASNACRDALDRLDASVSAAEAWSGPAADAYAQRRGVLVDRCADLDTVTARAARAIESWSAEAGAQRAVLVRARGQLLDLQQQDAAARRLGMDTPVHLHAELFDAVQAWRTAQAADRQEGEQLVRTLLGLREEISDAPVGLGGQVTDLVGTVWNRGVVEPVAGMWALTGQALIDPHAWWQDVRGGVKGLASSIETWWNDPKGAAGQAVDAPAWQAGHYGQGAGAVLAMALPGPRWARRMPGDRREIRPRGTPRPGPQPRLQTVDELLDGVDLHLHEHPDFGHTLARHVDVDDDYLTDRLTHGTLHPDGTRGGVPPEASRFTDRATADAAINETLRRYETELRAFAARPGTGVLRLDHSLGHDLGTVITPTPQGFMVRQGQVVRLYLRREPDGSVCLETAYVRSASG
ncbi:MAG: RNase A-like domain-containing protein [Kineosporiaceae bacterium]